MDIHTDILTWCSDATFDSGGSLFVWRTFGYWTSPSLPTQFDATALIRFRGRNFPDTLNLRFQMMSLDMKPLHDQCSMSVRPGPAIGDWQFVSATLRVSCMLHAKEQALVIDSSNCPLKAELFLPVVCP